MKIPFVILRVGIAGTVAAACVGLFAPAANAQFARACGNGVELRLRAPGAAAKAKPGPATQGNLVLVEVRSAVPLAELKAEWSGKEVLFWVARSASANNVDRSALANTVDRSGNVNDIDGSAVVKDVERSALANNNDRSAAAAKKEEGADKTGRGDVRRALIGVDLEKPAGKYELAIEAQYEDGERVSCKAAIAVRAGHFAVERLSVESKYVEPSPEDLARAERERQKMREIFATVTPERLWDGRFRLPLDGAHTGSNFGRRRILNGQPGSPHSGADFPAPAGTLVRAAQSGRVALAEPLYFSGNTVVIDHGLGVYTFYGHLESIDVSAGEDVKSGAVIGLVGATGRVTGPHLHWGLTVEGARVNPVEILRVASDK